MVEKCDATAEIKAEVARRRWGGTWCWDCGGAGAESKQLWFVVVLEEQDLASGLRRKRETEVWGLSGPGKGFRLETTN